MTHQFLYFSYFLVFAKFFANCAMNPLWQHLFRSTRRSQVEIRETGMGFYKENTIVSFS